MAVPGPSKPRVRDCNQSPKAAFAFLPMALSRRPRPRRWRILWFVLATPVVLIALLVGGYFLLWDWNYLRGYASERASTSAGRKIEITNIDIDLGWTTRIRLE